MKAALLDINVLLALAWPNHQHHDEAHNWFEREAFHGWATCAVTQLGFIRLSSNPAYTPDAVTPSDAASLLHDLVRHKAHRFWPSHAAAVPGVYANAIGHQQVNDAYLVRLAGEEKGRLITFDRRLSMHGGKPPVVQVIPGA